jgi:hypothetical protein
VNSNSIIARLAITGAGLGAVGTSSNADFVIQRNGTTKITVASALTTFADAIALSTNTTPSTSGGEAFLYKHSSNGTVLSGYNASIETGSAGSRSVRLAISDTGAITFNSAFTFPTTDGSNGQFLQTNGSGTVTWASAGSGTVTGSGTDHYIPRWNGTTALQDSSMIALDSGYVGIGTASPSTKFQVHSGDILITSGKQLITNNAYTNAPPAMLTVQGPSTGTLL